MSKNPRQTSVGREVRYGHTISVPADQRMQDTPRDTSGGVASTARAPRSIRHIAGRRPEARQLFARDLRLPQDAPLVFIEIGAAGRLRAECAAGHLVCPVP